LTLPMSYDRKPPTSAPFPSLVIAAPGSRKE